MTLKTVLFYCLGICTLLGQSATTIKGTIKNFDGDIININIYPNWEQNASEHYVSVDSSGRFTFEIILNDYNYVDLNIGKIGYLFWLIKEGDDIYLLLDYNNPSESFFASGSGASKWNFQHQYFLKYEQSLDADLLIRSSYNLSLTQFSAFVDSLTANKQQFLNQNRAQLQDEFFLLKKAEIIGKRNRHMVEYAQSKKIPADEIKKYLELFSVSIERQALSFEFNDFFDEWISLNKNSDGFEPNSLLDELNYLIRLFYNGKIERPMTELKMHQLLINYVENHTYQPEMQKGVDAYFEFVRNTKLKEKIKQSIDRKKMYFDGFPLPLLALQEANGEAFRNKELSKRNTLFYVYEDDCIICEEDFSYFDLIRSNFDKKEKFQLYTIPLNGNYNLEGLALTSPNQLLAENENQLRKTFGVKNSPEIYFINSEGVVFGDLPEPSLDEGRSLIKAIRNYMPEKDK